MTTSHDNLFTTENDVQRNKRHNLNLLFGYFSPAVPSSTLAPQWPLTSSPTNSFSTVKKNARTFHLQLVFVSWQESQPVVFQSQSLNQITEKEVKRGRRKVHWSDEQHRRATCVSLFLGKKSIFCFPSPKWGHPMTLKCWKGWERRRVKRWENDYACAVVNICAHVGGGGGLQQFNDNPPQTTSVRNCWTHSPEQPLTSTQKLSARGSLWKYRITTTSRREQNSGLAYKLPFFH